MECEGWESEVHKLEIRGGKVVEVGEMKANKRQCGKTMEGGGEAGNMG